MKHKLLVAIEGGIDSLATAAYAAQFCSGSGAGQEEGIVIFHVLEPHPSSVADSEGAVQGEAEHLLDGERRKAAANMLEQIKHRVISEGVNPNLVTTVMAEEYGSVCEQVIRAAAAHRCDTIVLGRRGKSLLREFVSGSVLERLLWKPIGYTIWIVDHAEGASENP